MTASKAAGPETGTANHLVRLGAWASLAVLSGLSAYYLYQHPIQLARGEAIASAEPPRQSQQTLAPSREMMTEMRRLSAAVATLNTDRDRLNARLSSIEQNLDSITGSLARQSSAAAAPPPAQVVVPQNAPENPGAGPANTASIASTASIAAAQPEASSSPGAIGIDLGTAASVEGLRALWRKETSASSALAALQPVVAVREKPGSGGVVLRLVAGPVLDAAEAARLCATLSASAPRACAPTAYDGQRLAMDVPPPAPRKRPAPLRLPSAPKPQAGTPQILPR